MGTDVYGPPRCTSVRPTLLPAWVSAHRAPGSPPGEPRHRRAQDSGPSAAALWQVLPQRTGRPLARTAAAYERAPGQALRAGLSRATPAWQPRPRAGCQAEALRLGRMARGHVAAGLGRLRPTCHGSAFPAGEGARPHPCRPGSPAPSLAARCKLVSLLSFHCSCLTPSGVGHLVSCLGSFVFRLGSFVFPSLWPSSAPPRGPESLRGVSCPPDVCGRRLFWGVSLRSWWFWQWKLDANVWTAPSVAIGPPDRPALPRMILTHEGFMEL